MAEILKVEILHDGWSRLSAVTCRLDDGQVIERLVEDHGRAAAVLPYDSERRVALLVRQFRAPVAMAGEAAFPEAPAGIVERGELAEETARRETLEEAGVRLKDIEPLGAYWSSPGVTTEKTDLFLAAYTAADRAGDGGGADHDEHIEVVELPLAELASMLECGQIGDLKLLSLVLMLMRRRPELFS